MKTEEDFEQEIVRLYAQKEISFYDIHFHDNCVLYLFDFVKTNDQLAHKQERIKRYIKKNYPEAVYVLKYIRMDGGICKAVVFYKK
jgi:hypothetical protein